MGDGFYYLHTNGDLIFKRFEPEIEPGGFVRKVWPVDIQDRRTAWTIILEGLAMGASIERVKELAAKWKCDLKDLPHLMVRVWADGGKPTPAMAAGANMFLEKIGGVVPDEYWFWLSQTRPGQMPNYDTMPTGATCK